MVVILNELIKTFKNPNLQYGKHQYIYQLQKQRLSEVFNNF